jgi:hypothetical protein
MRRLLIVLLFCVPVFSWAQDIIGFADMRAFPHSQLFSSQSATRTEYLVALGALQKIGGRWRHKDSEIVNGLLSSYTWQVNEAYTAGEGFEWWRQQIPDDATLLFECQGRSCGSSAQWADRVFSERVLYGHDERQHYAAFRLQREEGSYTLVLYASDRANRRHFLRLDVLLQERD